MDAGDCTEDVAGEVALGFEDVFDAAAFENDTCGICMDIVIDRGVLDCCSHWFCFVCIDNWATITNLCPICKNEFQRITCLPVYDTIGNIKVDEHLLSRDDDWYIQGRNNTLSFPSYYINEDAVICLDADGCKIRNKLSTEENLNLDTSIACDSCDIWYHAFCVGFDPDCTLENSWLCPRCIDEESPQNVDDFSEHKSGSHHDLRNAGSGQSVDSPFSGKVSVSVADAGETAIVVSMVEGKQLIRSSESDRVESELDTNTGIEMQALMANVDTCNTQLDQCSDRKLVDDGDDTRNIEADQVPSEFPLSVSSEKNIISLDDSMHENSFGSLSSVDALSDGTAICHEGEVVTSFVPSTSEVCDVPEEVVGDSSQHPSEEFSLSVDKLIKSSDENVSPIDRKNLEVNRSMKNHTESLRSPLMKDAYASDRHKKRERDSQAATEDCAIKEELDEGHQMVPQRRRIDTSIAINTKGCSAMTSTSKDSVSYGKEDCTSDIMSIVQDNDHKSSSRQLSGKFFLGKSTDGRQSGAGLRVKKIMWRAEDDKESSLLVQKLRNEIRETVGNQELSDLTKNAAFDGKLLSAFRAAIGPRDKPISKVDPTLVRGKKSLLQKGKVRENLTKKIYGTSGGRRRRAWDRDWEVEFWKHRCTSGKPEKAETLQSVLDLLKKIKSSPVNDEQEQGPNSESASSLLSRVYLADTSVLPRKEDIRPLSVLTGNFSVGIPQKEEQDKFSSLSEKNFATNVARTVSEISSNSSQGVVTSHGKRVMTDNSSFKSETSCRQEQSDGLKVGGKSYNNASRNSKEGEKSLKEPLANSDSARSDKRTWALEVLARKNALSNRDTSQRKEEDNPLLKEKYPLLAQLPMEMRPVPAPNHHNKVPMQVRKAQLYRLTEHYLRKANVPVICRTADVELAVADAINVEKEICERSKSKLVYINLCSQQTIHSKPQRGEALVPYSTNPAQGTEQVSNEQALNEMTYPALGHDSVEELLRQAGLLSDSPSNSPPQSPKCLDVDNPVVTKEKSFENLLEIDSHPDLDIYGDFDYDLDDEDYGGPSKMSGCQRESKVQSKDGDLKMKVVLSTVGHSFLGPKHDETLHSEKEQRAYNLGKPSIVAADFCTLPRHHDKDVHQSVLKTINGISYAATGSLQDKRCEEPSWQEYEELYGPDKEHSEKMVYEEPTSGNTTLADNKDDMLKDEATVSVGEHENCGGNTLAGSSLSVNHESSEKENSPTHSLPGEHIATKQISISGNKPSDTSNSVSKKVEAYLKEHIRPLCKSGVITVEQYRWAVGKATEKVMKYHCKAKNANFLIKEGDKVKKLVEEYVDASQRKEWKHKVDS